MSQAHSPLLAVENVRVHFPVRKGFLRRVVAAVQAVDGVSFSITKGRTLGIVGESGCGKTTLGRSVLRLLEPTSGSVRFDGRNILSLGGASLRALRRRMQIVFQDPYGSLNPRLTVRAILEEGLIIHNMGNAAARRERMVRSLRSMFRFRLKLSICWLNFVHNSASRTCSSRTISPSWNT